MLHPSATHTVESALAPRTPCKYPPPSPSPHSLGPPGSRLPPLSCLTLQPVLHHASSPPRWGQVARADPQRACLLTWYWPDVAIGGTGDWGGQFQFIDVCNHRLRYVVTERITVISGKHLWGVWCLLWIILFFNPRMVDYLLCYQDICMLCNTARRKLGHSKHFYNELSIHRIIGIS